MTANLAALSPQLNVSIRIIENNQERLDAHQKFDGEVALVLNNEEFDYLTDRERLLVIEKMLKNHQAALKPLEAVNNVLVNVARAL